MATNSSTAKTAAGQPTDSSKASTASLASTELTPVPKGEKAGPAAATALDLKHKITDPNLKIVTIDPFYDLTLIVGTPGRINGQAAFRVNKGSLRHASDIWTKMLTGAWAESNQSEISFPDDIPWAFLLILRIAHLQLDQLPVLLNLTEMKALAVLTDKYNLVKLIRVALDSKQWLTNVRWSTWRMWPAQPCIQEWAFITHVFQCQDDYDYLVSRLAVEVQVDATDVSFYHVTGDKATKLRSTLPDRILTQIHHIRTSILQEWITCCNTAIDEAIQKRADGPSTSCGKATCKATKIGIIVMGLQAAGLYPVPESAQTMYRSVVWYWRALKSIGAEFKVYKPCDGALGHGKGNHYSSCSFDKCLGDFGLLTRAEATLKQYGHNDVLTHLLSNKFMQGPA